MKKASRRSRAAKILTTAIDKTEKVQDDLTEASRDLNKTNTVLSGPLSTAQAIAAVAGAVKQNIAAENKVQEAAEELETVKDMLKAAQSVQTGETLVGNVGEGAASILPHLEAARELGQPLKGA